MDRYNFLVFPATKLQKQLLKIPSVFAAKNKITNTSVSGESTKADCTPCFTTPSLIWYMILTSASSWLLERYGICVSVPANTFQHWPSYTPPKNFFFLTKHFSPFTGRKFTPGTEFYLTLSSRTYQNWLKLFFIVRSNGNCDLLRRVSMYTFHLLDWWVSILVVLVNMQKCLCSRNYVGKTLCYISQCVKTHLFHR